ncbi:unnamed protein product, partial [Prorocentrum cordatum]
VCSAGGRQPGQGDSRGQDGPRRRPEGARRRAGRPQEPPLAVRRGGHSLRGELKRRREAEI